ncbi:MAG: DUF1549 domain-containing protein [Pirellulales bacterium]
MDSRAAALKGGDTQPAVVPGDVDPKKSLLIDTINYGELYQMPPKGKLPPEEIAILTKWVASGAPWPHEVAAEGADAKKFDLEARKKSHWCWQPIADPAPPTVRDAGWPADPLDRFVLAKLEAASLRPTPDADRRALVRRVYYDLHGMAPPDVDPEFVRTGKSEDWASLIDELLASPRYGEHWARHWLDLARFAETYGHEFDYPIHNAWRYRDYVIRAFNADVPYDRFAREQIAGDLEDRPRFDPATGFNESIVGTGFWYFGEQTHAPVDVRQHDADRVDNMVDVYGKTFLGLTIACARCHDHKFDAIATKDYYAITGILRGTREQQAYLDPHEAHARSAAELRQHVDAAREATLDHWAVVPIDAPTQLARELATVLALGPKPSDADLNAAATREKLDPARLGRWLAALRGKETAERDHPAWFRAARVRRQADRRRRTQRAGHCERNDDHAAADEGSSGVRRFLGRRSSVRFSRRMVSLGHRLRRIADRAGRALADRPQGGRAAVDRRRVRQSAAAREVARSAPQPDVHHPRERRNPLPPFRREGANPRHRRRLPDGHVQRAALLGAELQRRPRYAEVDHAARRVEEIRRPTGAHRTDRRRRRLAGGRRYSAGAEAGRRAA